MVYSYYGEEPRPVERRSYTSASAYQAPVYQAPVYQAPVTRTQQTYTRPAAVQATQTNVQQSKDIGFAQMVDSSQCGLGETKVVKPAAVEKYNPYLTSEHKVDIPYLHPVDIPQVVHDTRVVVVPQPVAKPVIQTKLVTEKPTEIHHIEIAKKAAPVVFAEESVAAGWPWWWWIPLLLLCCCLPLCCCLMYWLCCRKKPVEKPKPKPMPKPEVKKQVSVEKKPPVKEQTEVQQRKKFAYTKNEYDQEKEIEAEIQRELEVSRLRKTKDERPIVYHHTRYIEKPRYVEEAGIEIHNRTATYDAVNRSASKYQHIDDSYYLQQQKPERIERVVERTYAPGVIEIDSRRTGSASRKSRVNPLYQADMGGGNSRRTGEAYVSREQVNAPNRYLELPGSQRAQLASSIKREGDISPNRGYSEYRMESEGVRRVAGTQAVSSGRVGSGVGYDVGGTRVAGGTSSGAFRTEGNVYEVNDGYGYRGEGGEMRVEGKTSSGVQRSGRASEGGYIEGPAIREEAKLRSSQSRERNQSPKSYSSNQNLRTGNQAEARGQGLAMKKAPATQKRYAESSDDDDDSY